jgi:P27 family predicted phage terminase small subunit
MVMLLALRLSEVQERTDEIARDGAVYSKIELIEVPGADGKLVTKAQKIHKTNPAVAQRSEAMRHVQSLLAEFGLSPASRGKVSRTSGAEEPGNRWEALI